VFPPPVVLLKSAKAPVAVLLSAVLLKSAWLPVAVLLLPLVLLKSAYVVQPCSRQAGRLPFFRISDACSLTVAAALISFCG